MQPFRESVLRFIPHKHRPPRFPEAPPNLEDKAQDEDSGESSNKAKRRDRMPDHVSPGSNECNRNVFRSHGRPEFGAPNSEVARWFAPVFAVGMQRAVI